jgi:hypothetical protein
MRGPPSGAIQPSIVTMEPTPCVTTAPWRPRVNINRDSGSNTGGSGGGLFQQTQMFGRLNTPGWPDDHNLAVTTSVDSDEDEGQSFGISRDLPLFLHRLILPLPVVSKFRTFCQIPRPWIGCRRRQINTRSSTYSFANASSSSRTSWPINVRSTSFSCVCRKMGNPVWPSCQNFLTKIVVRLPA